MRRRLAESQATALVIDRTGEILNLIPTEQPPSVEFVMKLKDQYPGLAFRLLPRGEYSTDELERIIREVMDGYELLDQGLIPPGATFR